MRELASIEPNYRILVVDDNRAIHDDIRKILVGDTDTNDDLLSDESFLFDSAVPAFSSIRFQIDSAYQGQEALRKVQQIVAGDSSYAVAFVDVRMPPGWDGIETIVRLWEVDPNLQVVICTAFSDYSWKEILTKLGHSDNLLVLKKPFDSIEVVQMAHALTRKWLVSAQARMRVEDLNQVVERRTAELQAANRSLQAEFASRAKAEEAFRVVFEASPIGIALLDTDLKLVNANRALQELLGVHRDAIVGNDPVELGWFKAQAELNSAIAAGLTNGGIDQYEIKLNQFSPGGGTGLLWARDVEIGGVQHALCFVLDISERVEMETDLRRARVAAEAAAKAKSDFLANMSHEIRTPLNGILGLSTFLEDKTLPDSVRDVGSLIRTSGEMLRRVLDDVLDFSKIESGKLEIENEPFSPREALEWSIGIYRKAALDKSLDLKLVLPDSLPGRLVGDVTRIQQILTNLISNAIKFTDFGSIEVAAEVERSCDRQNRCQLHVSVCDTGIGIPSDRMDRLFKSFSQIDASINRRFGGTGLGLAICKRLAELMGGNMQVMSEPGQGTTFSFSIPVGLDESEPEVKRDGIWHSRRVLVVEDNPINCVVIRRLLERLGHQVDLVTDGDMAIRHVQDSQCDLVLMDVNMPGLDGLEATRRIRELDGPRSAIPVLALTASALINDRQACLEAGMNDYLSKPISIDALRAAIEMWTPNSLGSARTSVLAAI